MFSSIDKTRKNLKNMALVVPMSTDSQKLLYKESETQGAAPAKLPLNKYSELPKYAYVPQEMHGVTYPHVDIIRYGTSPFNFCGIECWWSFSGIPYKNFYANDYFASVLDQSAFRYEICPPTLGAQLLTESLFLVSLLKRVGSFILTFRDYFRSKKMLEMAFDVLGRAQTFAQQKTKVEEIGVEDRFHFYRFFYHVFSLHPGNAIFAEGNDWYMERNIHVERLYEFVVQCAMWEYCVRVYRVRDWSEYESGHMSQRFVRMIMNVASHPVNVSAWHTRQCMAGVVHKGKIMTCPNKIWCKFYHSKEEQSTADGNIYRGIFHYI